MKRIFAFDQTYSHLSESLLAKVAPVPVKAPRLIIFNDRLAAEMGLDVAGLEQNALTDIFAGNIIPAGAEPIAQAYAGHQFGNFTMLGDGRAVLLGEQITPDNQRLDVQLKGSGKTPFSRGGDGRAALGPMLREYIISEAMHGLGIATTRSLAVVATGEPVIREQPLPGAVLTRVASSHIRVGTFEYAVRAGGAALVRLLADYTVARHFPQLMGSAKPYLGLLNAVMERQAELVARWVQVGFIHGVMNTDNTAISGETIDYGPCAFMDAYDPATVFSSIDRQGRYGFGNQAPIMQWNLARFAETLLPLLHADPSAAVEIAEATLNAFPEIYEQKWLEKMRGKLGLSHAEEGDRDLVMTLLDWMHRTRADYTNSFRALSEADANSVFLSDPPIAAWYARWQARMQRQPGRADDARQIMRAHNPAVIARNHRVEEALAAAAAGGDLKPMENLLNALQSPYDDLPIGSALASPSQNTNYRTFCGT